MARIEYSALNPRPPTPQSTSWRPSWLRRRVFMTYIAIFVLVVALDGGLYGYSSRSDGLAPARQAHEWLWRLGPVALLTVLAAFWTRVEFQAMVYQPWINLLRSQDKKGSNCYLDYTDMLQPVAIFNSARNGHLLVFLTLLIGVFLKIQIILAPALFHLSSVEVPVNVPLTVHDAFEEPSGILETLDPRPYYTFYGKSEYNHSLPFGIGDRIAYQTFSAADDGPVQYDTSQAPIEAEVDAFMIDLHCLPLDRCDSTSGGVQNGTYTRHYSLSFDGCGGDSGSLAFDTMETVPSKPGDISSFWRGVAIIPGEEDVWNYTCDTITKTNNPFAIIRIQRTLLDTNTTDGAPEAHLTCHGITCSPDTYLTKALVTDRGANQNVRVLDSSDRRPLGSGIGAFDYILTSSFPDLSSPDLWITPGIDRVFPLDWMADMGFIPADFESAEWDVITDGLRRFYEAMSPAVGHFRMKSMGENEVEGRRLVQADRLVVDGRIAAAIASLSGAASILAAWLLLAFVPERDLFARDPATILGSAAYLARLPELTSLPFPKPAAPRKPSRRGCQSNEDKDWGSVARYPLPLRPAFRLLFVTCVAGVIATLVALAIKSQRSESGIAVILNEASSHLYWTVVPALAMFLTSTYVQSCNSQLRSLSLFRRLASADTPATFLDVSLRDMLSPLLIYRSTKMGLFNVALSEVLAVLAMVLGMLAGLLYTTDTAPGVVEVRVAQADVFYPLEPPRDDDLLFENRVSLNLFLMDREGESIVYPRGTHRDLVFPTLDLKDAAANSRTDNKSAVATVPGLQLEQDCSYVPRSHLQFNITGDPPEAVSVIQHRTCPSGNSTETLLGRYGEDTPGGMLYIGVTTEPGLAFCVEDDPRAAEPVMKRSYTWGAFNLTTWSFENLRSADCAYSFSEVDVELTLTGRDLQELDVERPPRVINGTARKPQREIGVPLFYQDAGILGAVLPVPTLESPSVGALVAGDFKVLFEPFGGIPHSMAADTRQAAADAILGSLNYNTRLTAAQLVSLESRLRVSDLKDNDPPPPVSIRITENDRKILTQNTVPAVLIASILTILALVHVWGLVSTLLTSRAGAASRSRAVLDLGIKERVPDGAWSIASMASLLRGSNMAAVLPEEVFWLPPKMAEAFLAGVWCRMCWLGEGVERYFTVAFVGSSRTGGAKGGWAGRYGQHGE